MTLLEHVLEARRKFIYYHQRGLEESKWYRPNSMYIYWAFLDEDDRYFTPAFEVFDLTCHIFDADYDYDNILFQFDLMEKIAKQ